MIITKRQLRRIIQESLNETGYYSLSAEDMAFPDELTYGIAPDPGPGPVIDEEIVAYLTHRAKGYHQDPALDIDGDGIPDAPAVRELLQDDFLEEFGYETDIQDYAALIDKLSQSLTGLD